MSSPWRDDLITRIRQRANDPAQAYDMVATKPGIANPPIAPEQLAAAESVLGFALPEFLRQLYLQVGNGGFGPGYGLFPLYKESTAYDRDLMELYLNIAAEPLPPPYQSWPAALLFMADWGCGIYSLVNRQDGSVHRFHGDEHTDESPWESIMVPESPSLEAWFEDWFARPGRERFNAY